MIKVSKLTACKAEQKIATTTNYNNYGPKGIAKHHSRHGYNGELSIQNGNQYILGNGNRIYLSGVGHFNQQDRLNISNGGGINSYVYCSHNPINQCDPSGNKAIGSYSGSAVVIIGSIVSIICAIPTGGASFSINIGVSIITDAVSIVLSSASITLRATDNVDNIANIMGWGSVFTSGVSAINRIYTRFTKKATSRLVISEIGLKNDFGLDEIEDVTKVNNGHYVDSLYTNNYDDIKLTRFKNHLVDTPQMIEEDALIVSQNLKKVEDINEQIKNPMSVYKIDTKDIKESSVNHHLAYNRKNLMKHTGVNNTNDADNLSLILEDYPEKLEAHLDMDQLNK